MMEIAASADRVEGLRRALEQVGREEGRRGEPARARPRRAVAQVAARKVLRFPPSALKRPARPLACEAGAEVAREGCLSIPDLTANVRRATQIEVRAWTPPGEPVELGSEGFEARCLLHEIDHLDGCRSSTESTRWPRTASAASATPDAGRARR